MMFQVRVHGRGGLATVTTTELLAIASFLEGRYAQVLPRFPIEAAGEPAEAGCRIADVPIRGRERVHHPDAVIVQDATLRTQVDVFAGMSPGGYALIDSPEEMPGVEWYDERLSLSRTAIVPATTLALAYTGRAQPAPALLGAFAALTGQVSFAAVIAAVYRRFPARLAEGDVLAARAGFGHVRATRRQLAAA
jgi:pyruvate ferredoxin oxidoreductase gamma subunit